MTFVELFVVYGRFDCILHPKMTGPAHLFAVEVWRFLSQPRFGLDIFLEAKINQLGKYLVMCSWFHTCSSKVQMAKPRKRRAALALEGQNNSIHPIFLPGGLSFKTAQAGVGVKWIGAFEHIFILTDGYEWQLPFPFSLYM